MDLALYHPEHGYYASGRALLGREGDFFTSVSVGPVYGEMLGTQFLEMWDRLSRPGSFTIVEQGAHDGTFAADVLAWAQAEEPAFHEAIDYAIIEQSPALQAKQEARLAGFKVRWSHNLEPFEGVHFSNELFDALPVQLVRFQNGAWRELFVTADLTWADQPAEVPVDAPHIEGYTTEISPGAVELATEIARKIRRGWILAVDYGYPHAAYYAPERHTGTLQCYSQHKKKVDPLANPGFQDITAHVDFTNLASAFLHASMDLAGYADQHHFLTGIISQRPPSPHQLRGLKTLLHPELMGRSFHVLCVSRGVPLDPPLAGFRYARDASKELGLI